MRNRLRPILVALLALAAWATFERWSHTRLTPPPGVKTLDTFLRWRPQTERVLVLSAGGNEYLCATGPKAGGLPSGPSAYVFDRNGKLVDWTADAGDDFEFKQKWSFYKPVGELSTSDAARRTTAPHTQPATMRNDPEPEMISDLRPVGFDPHRAHNVDYSLYFPTARAADRAAADLRREGYRVSIKRAADDRNWLVLASRRMVPAETDIEALLSRLAQLAADHGGEYDGWEAEPSPL